MSTTALVRFSREGDQFHYLWAARRCLRLLLPSSGLVAVSIEGASTQETAPAPAIDAGEELIDVAEYYGSEDIEQATRIRYLQLKHSTLRTTEPWTASGLEKTLKGFADRYRALEQRLGAGALQGKLEFGFVSNRPISADIRETVADAAAVADARHPKELKKFEDFTGLDGIVLSDFCKLLHLEGDQEGYWDQRNLLVIDASDYLPGSDFDGPVRLKELVTRKALPESAANPTITKTDVLRALQTDTDRLFPALSLIKPSTGIVAREQEADLARQIIQTTGRAIIVHADAGVGKSVFATRIGQALPEGSVRILYDCFGNGLYRNASGYRHRHKDALVQIANELAGQGLCYPLIPSVNADATDYMRAFLARVKASVAALRAARPGALLCIAIDAADNAQMAANEIGETRSFARDLLREKIPEGVRLVVLCRTHRRQLLDPPPQAVCLEIKPFSRAETAVYLRQTFPDASDHDVDEFHRLSSQNPRVQATALSRQAPLAEMLRALGPNPTSVADTIAHLLAQAVADLRDKAGQTEQASVDLICAGLAALRPLIPISVLAAISGVDEAAVRSFAVDLGRPLVVLGGSVQFFDEPAETWFRERFKPKADQLASFIDRLKPLASSSAYVASALPQMMLEAGQFDELVALAISSEGLPAASPLEKRDVELQRLQFALKASLRAKHYMDAAKLALKAGGETAGDRRQQKLLQDNTDLASALMEVDRIEEVVSRRSFGGGWVGAHHVYEAAFMSGHTELQGDARSRLRMAHEWLRNWSRLPAKQRERENLTDPDIAELAMAHLNIHGPENAAHMLRGWTPRETSFRAGRLLAKRLVDHGRYEALDALALAGENDLCLILAINLELRCVERCPPAAAIERAFRLARAFAHKIQKRRGWDAKETLFEAMTALAVSCHKLSIGGAADLEQLLTQYLPTVPPRALSSRYVEYRSPLLRAYTLLAGLSSKPLQLNELAHPDLRKELEDGSRHHYSRDAQEFREIVGALLPWYQLWARAALGEVTTADLAVLVEETKSASEKAAKIHYREESWTSNEIAEVWLEILATSRNAAAPTAIEKLNQYIAELKRPLLTRTLVRLARLAARRPGFEAHSFDYAHKAFELARDERVDAEIKASTYIDAARAILAVSKEEAAEYFNKAVEVASKIGDEHLDRWAAILDLADRAAVSGAPNAETAYKLARCAEVTYDYVDRDKHFDWDATVTAIAALCPSSSLAILSRWRDRDFGRAERLLPVAVEYLLEQRWLDAKAAQVLICFRADWDAPLLLDSTLRSCSSQAEKSTIFEFVYAYMRLGKYDASAWRKVKQLVTDYDIAASHIDEIIGYHERRERSKTAKENNDRDHFLEKEDETKDHDWKTVFSELDLTNSNDLSRANVRFRQGPPPYYHNVFFEEAAARVPTGKEAELIRAFGGVPEFDLYCFRSFLESIPESWKTRLAVRAALADTLRVYCRRYCMEIARSRYYQVLPLKTACDLAEVSEAEAVEVVLSAIGEAPEIVGSGRLFTLVGLLVQKLSHAEALDALLFGLSLFEPVLEDRDGDGPWSSALSPPFAVEDGVAGYIWGGLASPRAQLRWEAAHAVRGLCRLRQAGTLGSLVRLAQAGLGGAFLDARLHFYGLHARQWLVIALARAAAESPAMVAPHSDFLIDLALRDAPHVLIREFAARAGLTVNNAGHLPLSSELRDQLKNVNKPRLPVQVSRAYDRYNNQRSPSGSGDRFLFGIDIGPYWFGPLGRHFGKSEADIAAEAEQIIRGWGCLDYDRWDKDERVRRRIFRDRETLHSHGSYPRTDDLRFYLAYNAMMITAGKLLETAPMHRDPYEPEEGFHQWLAENGLTRSGGDWLADRRDPAPLEWQDWFDEHADENWRWSVTGEDFACKWIGEGTLVLSGFWTTIRDRRKESVSIASALVSPDRSEALLRALQTAGNHHDYRIPDADDDLQIDHGSYRLTGWVIDHTQGNRLDRYDPWAGDIGYPPIVPAPRITGAMNLAGDLECRTWRMDGKEDAALSSYLWGGEEIEDGYAENEHDRGRRLIASGSFVMELLTKMQMDLIVKVEIARENRRYNYETTKDEGLDYILPSARLFLVHSDGRIHGL